MYRQVFALSALAAGVSAATGNVTALCTTLLSSCSAQWPAGGMITEAQCEQLFGAAVGTTLAALGDDSDTGVNTIGCRQNYAMKAASNMTALGYNCIFAGFTGGGLCGPVLDNTCAATLAICNQVPNGLSYMAYTDVPSCKQNLAGITAVWGSLQGPSSSAEDSQECRVYHALAALAGGTGAEFHCGHTGSPGNASFCGGTVSTNANHHCASTLINCNVNTPVPRQQYNDMGTCLASFTTFPDGPVSSSSALNDRGCRQYHGNAGYSVDPLHCAHGGPSGGGVCGGTSSSRQSWNIMSGVASCAAIPQFKYLNTSVHSAFANWAAADLLTIVPQGTATVTNYSTTSAAGSDDDACRIYHLSVATTTPVPHCAHGDVSGSNVCGVLSTVVCRLFNASCGTAAYADAATCATAVNTMLAANKTGTPTLVATSTDDLACRIYQAGLALAQKNMAQSTSAACNGAKATSTVCGATMMKPSSASTAMVSLPVVVLAALFAL